MRSRLLLFVGLALLFGGPAHGQRWPAGVVKIRAVAQNGAVQLGSGVVMQADHVATACHVTRGASLIEIEYDDGMRQHATRQVGNPSRDLCVLHVPDLRTDPLSLRASATLKVGEKVVAVGFEHGGAVVAKQGVVASLYSYDGGYVIRTTAAFDFGSSGGGLLDESGNLVGILSFKGRSGASSRFALPTEWLSPEATVARAFMVIEASSRAPAFWEQSREDRPAFLGVALREVASSDE